MRLGHTPTPIDAMANLAAAFDRVSLFVKRDDCTGLAFGGNKVCRLEFYLCEARAQDADTILITGAVQSNFVRLAAAATARLGMACQIQIEERVPRDDALYPTSCATACSARACTAILKVKTKTAPTETSKPSLKV